MKQLILVLSVVALKVFAQDTTSTATLPLSPLDSKKINLLLGLQYSSNLQKKNDPDRASQMQYILNPSYQFASGAVLDVRTAVVQQMENEERTYFTDTIIVGALKAHTLIENKLQFTPMLALIAPTDNRRYEEESYRGTISLRPRLTILFPNNKKLRLINTLYVNRNIHEFEIKSSREENVEYSARYRLTVEYNLNSKLSLNLTHDYTRGLTYEGSQRETFYVSQEVSYEVFRNTSIYIGHQNEGLTRGPGNSGTNVSAFDDRSSEIYGGVSKLF